MPTSSARIVLVDAIRGFALLGLFVVHTVEYFELYWYKPEPGWIHDSIFFLFGGKAYALFALMFGFSFYRMVEWQYGSQGERERRFAWRMVLLWLFGYLHSLLYAGDILQILALGGVYLLLVHRLTSRSLGLLALVFLLKIPAIVQYVTQFPSEIYQKPRFWALMAENFQVFAHSNLLDLVRYNAWLGQYPKWVLNFETGGVYDLLGLFTLGLLLGRWQVFERQFSRSHLVIALGMSGVAAAVLAAIRAKLPPAEDFMVTWAREAIVYSYFAKALVALYVCAFLLAFHLGLRRWLQPLTACGRMSLTLYLGQSLVFVPLFYGFGLAWYEDIGQVNALIVALTGSVVQIILANAWLRRYAQGPMEALWRKLTNLWFDKPPREPGALA